MEQGYFPVDRAVEAVRVELGLPLVLDHQHLEDNGQRLCGVAEGPEALHLHAAKISFYFLT